MIRQPDAGAALGAIRGSANADGDDQKALDVLADEMIEAALAECRQWRPIFPKNRMTRSAS